MKSMKSSRFHHEIRCFSKNSSDFTRFGGGFHGENLPDFMKSTGFHLKSARFHEIHWIHMNFMKSTRFHMDFMKSARFHEIHQISYRFHEIHQISYRFHEIQQISCEIERPLQGIVTLCCVVFLYNVPPLMGQVLGKVLLTSWEIS